VFEVKQYIISGAIAGAVWMLPAIGMSLVYALLRIPHFALAELMTLGAYLAFAFSAGLGLPFLLAAALAALISGTLAAVADQALFRPVRRAGLLPAMLLSLGLMIILQNTVRFFWGNQVRQYRIPLERPIDILGFDLTVDQVLMLAVAAVFAAAVFAFLKWTRFGMEVRATANNVELARVTGIEPERVYAGLSWIAGMLAGVGGVMLGAYTSLTPLMGWNSLLPLFAITLLGGLGRIGGAALAALVVGVAMELSLLVLPSSYKVGLAFAVLAVLLVLRPRGLVAEG
jgi:branched-subunit amino acid ABC-type transport system permease component